MVQKKGPDKHGSPGEPRKNHAKPEKRLYSQQQHHHHQDSRGGCGGGSSGGGDLRKMLKKSRSIKVLEESLDSPAGTQLVQLGKPPAQTKKKRRSSLVGVPNYMKSTSSSNAKREKAQVSSRLSDLMQKKPPSAAGAPALKPAKFLARKSSLRPLRPPMKMILQGADAIRATCSSTMKEISFPDHLDLNPGGTEAGGTSVFKVCPYTYCSLNGHRHAPLPPLRCFLSARRRLLKTQKSMKLRGLASFRKIAPEKEEEEEVLGIGAEQGFSATLVEDLGGDFFVEIYAKCRTDASAPVGDDGVTADVTASTGDGGEDCKEEIEEDVGSPIDDSGSQVSLDESFDQISEFSPSEMEVLINFLEYVECDPEDLPCPAHDLLGDYWSWDCDDSGGFGDELAEEEGGCGPASGDGAKEWGEEDGLYIDFDEIDYSEYAEDESIDGVSFLFNANGVECDENYLGIRGFEEDDEETVGEIENGTASEEAIEATTSTLENLIEEEEEEEEVEGMFVEQEGEAVVVQQKEYLSVVSNSTEAMGDPLFGDDVNENNSNAQVGDAEELSQETPADETKDINPGINKLFSEVNTHTVEEEEKQGKMENDQNECSNTEMETWQHQEGDESLIFEEELPVESDDKLGVSSKLSTAASTELPQDDAAITTAATRLVGQEHTDTDNGYRARALVTRKKASGDEEEELRPFNPREPNFLPVEPDPEGEKVDLRHQMMEERKNSEEWMIDYALRRAVDKLAPGRKRKVALLVEAFETVTPEHPYGSTLGHSSVGFPHARPIQACS